MCAKVHKFFYRNRFFYASFIVSPTLIFFFLVKLFIFNSFLYFILCFFAIFFKVSPCFTIYILFKDIVISGFFALFVGFEETIAGLLGTETVVGFFVDAGLLVLVVFGFVVVTGFVDVDGLLGDLEPGFDEELDAGFVVLDELLLLVVLLFDELLLFDATGLLPFCLGVRACIFASSAAVM